MVVHNVRAVSEVLLSLNFDGRLVALWRGKLSFYFDIFHNNKKGS